MELEQAQHLVDWTTKHLDDPYQSLECKPVKVGGLGRSIDYGDGQIQYYDPANDRDGEMNYLSAYIVIAGSRTFGSLSPREKMIHRNLLRVFHAGLATQAQQRVISLVNFGLSYNDGKNVSIVDHDLKRLNPKAEEPRLADYAPQIVGRPMMPTVEESISLGLKVIGEVCERYRMCGDDGIEHVVAAMESDVGGTVTWFSRADFRTSTMFTDRPGPYTLPLGVLETGDEIHYQGEQSLAAIAPPGSGKTQGFVLPTLAEYQGSALVLDVKGECWAAWQRVRPEGVEGILFSPERPQESAHYNPLTFVSRDPLYLFEDARILAHLVVAPDPSSREPFWNDAARDLLSNLIAVAVDKGELFRSQGLGIDMRLVCGFAWSAGKDMEALLQLMDNSKIEALKEGGQGLRNLIYGYSGTGGAEKTFQNIQETLRRHLAAWRGPLVRSVTEKSTWDPSQMRDKPMRVHVKVSPRSIQPLNSLLRVVIGQHLHQLMPITSSEKAKVPILVMLDELPQLGYMEPVRQAVEVGRSYGIRSWLFAQYLGQLEDAYGKEIARGLVNACGVHIVMNANGDDAKALSELLGYRTDVLNGERRPFVEPQDLSGPTYREYAIIKGSGEKPAKVRKQYFWKQYPDADAAE